MFYTPMVCVLYPDGLVWSDLVWSVFYTQPDTGQKTNISVGGAIKIQTAITASSCG